MKTTTGTKKINYYEEKGLDDQSIAHTDHHIDDSGCYGDNQGNACTGPGTCPDITSEVITSEPVVKIIQTFFFLVIDLFGSGRCFHAFTTIEDTKFFKTFYPRCIVLLCQ